MNKLYIRSFAILTLLASASLSQAQNVGINTTGTNPSINAILDLNTGNANNLGLIIPNVSLTALGTFNPPIANAPTAGDKGMMVYNTNAAVGSGVGYYYWDGAKWQAVGGTVGGAGTLNYLALWTPNGTTLGIGLTQDNGVEVAIQTGAYAFTAGNPLLLVTSNASNPNAISGVTTTASSYGVRGSNSAVTGTSTGVQGFIGGALNAIPVPSGIYGSTATANTYAILGSNSQTGGTNVGVGGYLGALVTPQFPAGVYGSATTNANYGVEGMNSSSTNTGGAGVYGYDAFPATGIIGTNTTLGTFGFYLPPNGVGGNFFGLFNGVQGTYVMTAPGGTGVLGLGYNSAGAKDPNPTGIYDFGVAGEIGGPTSGGYQGAGVGGFIGTTTNSPLYTSGVLGGSNFTTYPGVIGFNTDPTGVGVQGTNTTALGASTGIGVIGQTSQSNGYGVVGQNANAAGYGVEALNSGGVLDPALLSKGTSNLRGVVTLGQSSTANSNGSLIFDNSTNANTVTINSGVTTASYPLTLPTAQGAANTTLVNNGAGVLSWGATGGALNNIQVITASGNYVVTAGTTKSLVICIGGGGGGGGCNPLTNPNFAACAGGGGAGGYCMGLINNPVGPYACTIGAGGAGGNGGPSNGAAGGTTTMNAGVVYTANGGGGGGLCQNNNGVQAQAGTGGTAINGILNATGAPGGAGQFFYVAGIGYCQAGTGVGGSTEFGGGGAAPVSKTNAPGNNGNGYGSGGSGGMGVSNPGGVGGGNGAPGVIIVYEYK